MVELQYIRSRILTVGVCPPDLWLIIGQSLGSSAPRLLTNHTTNNQNISFFLVNILLRRRKAFRQEFSYRGDSPEVYLTLFDTELSLRPYFLATDEYRIELGRDTN